MMVRCASCNRVFKGNERSVEAQYLNHYCQDEPEDLPEVIFKNMTSGRMTKDEALEAALWR